MIEIDQHRAREVAATALQEHQVPPDDAHTTAEMLVAAEAWGKPSHGLIRLPRYIRGIKYDNVDTEGTIEVIRDAGASATINGGARLGPAVATRALGEATARADEYGIGIIGVHNCTHLGMLGYYTDMVRQEGYVSIAMTNTEPAMPPYGGTEPVLGTNPIAVGLPTDPPFNLDMSTAAIARGTIETAADRDELIPEGVALDADGEPTTDPEAALEGTILPFGGPKGSGLAIAIEVLAGALVGAEMGENVTGTYHTEDPCTKGDLFLVIDPEALGGEAFVNRTEAFFHELKEIETAPKFDEIRLPGEESIGGGSAATINVDVDVWETILDLAEQSKS